MENLLKLYLSLTYFFTIKYRYLPIPYRAHTKLYIHTYIVYIHTYTYAILYIGVTDLQVMHIFDCNTNTVDITVRWVAANSPYCGGVLYYIVMISSDEHSNIMNNTVIVTVSTADVTMFNATFSNLRNDTNYNITINAVNRAGAGMTNAVMNIRTSSPVMTQRNVTSTCVCVCIIYKRHNN